MLCDKTCVNSEIKLFDEPFSPFNVYVLTVNGDKQDLITSKKISIDQGKPAFKACIFVTRVQCLCVCLIMAATQALVL